MDDIKMLCPFCHEDIDGYVTPLEKNGHAYIRNDGFDGWHIEIKANGWRGLVPMIRFCPMCGRKLKNDK